MNVENDTPTNTPNPAAAFQSLLQKHQNDANQVALALFGDNHRLRSDKRKLTSQLKALQGKVPADGAVVLTGEKAKAWEAYQALGKPEEIKSSLEARSGVEKELKELRRGEQIRSVSEVAGYKSSVLSRLAQLATEELEFAVEEVESDGEKIQRAVVKQGETKKPLAEYAKEHWTEFLPALEQKAQAGAAGNAGAIGNGNSGAGTRLPAQTGGGKASKPGILGDYITQMNERAASAPNPLVPKTTGA